MGLRNPDVNSPVLAAYAADKLTTGEYCPDLDLCNGQVVAQGSQSLLFSYFTANKTETITTITAYTGATAAAATPTICQYAVWSVAADGTHTQVAVTANDTTLFSVTNTAYPKVFTGAGSFTKTAGQRYACSVLIVSAAAMPTFVGQSWTMSATGALLLGAPARSARLAAQATMPAGPVASGSLVSTLARYLFKLS